MFLWCATVAAVVAIGLHAWLAHRCKAEWSPLLVLLAWLSFLGMSVFGTRDVAGSLLLTAIAPSTLVLATSGHVDRLEDRRWKSAEGAKRLALRRSQRWVLARWVTLMLVVLGVGAAFGVVPPG